MKKVLFIFYLFFIVSCGILPPKNNYYTEATKLELGVVGKKQKSVQKTSFQTFGIPKYDKKIRLLVSAKPFSKAIYKGYQKALTGNWVAKTVKYTDSIIAKLTYINVVIQDRVAVVSALNLANKNVFEYLKKSPNATLVSGVRLVGDADFQYQIQRADAFYLQTDDHQKQWLYLHKDQKEIGKLDFSKTIIFGYKLSSFCWKIDAQKKIKIATIIGQRENCLLDTERNVQDLEKKIVKQLVKF
ncbi:MAG: hypothetical protein ACK5H1_01290 [Tenacibaculum sp.]